MKRIIATILALVMGASLVACGSASSTESKYEDVISLLEDKNYDGAINLIEQMKNSPETDEKGEENGERLDVNTMEIVYNTVTQYLDNMDSLYINTTNYEIFDHITNSSKSFETKKEYFAYFKDCLEKLGDYKESKDYLKRIYSVENVLLYTKTTYVDAFGAEQNQSTRSYAYAKDSKLSAASSDSGMHPYLTTGSYGRHTYIYGEAGNLQKLEFKSGNSNSLSAVFEYTYENGNVKTASYKNSNGDGRTIEYEYDSEGKAVKIKGAYCNYGSGDVDVIFEYNSGGQLVREYCVSDNGYRTMYTYEYDGDGNLTYKEKTVQDIDTRSGSRKYPAYYTGWKYTYDKEGRIATETEIDFGYLNENRQSVNYSGEVIENPDLEFDRVTTYYYGDFFGFEKK